MYEFTTLKINFSLVLHNLEQGSENCSTQAESHLLSVLEIEFYWNTTILISLHIFWPHWHYHGKSELLCRSTYSLWNPKYLLSGAFRKSWKNPGLKGKGEAFILPNSLLVLVTGKGEKSHSLFGILWWHRQ